MQFTYLEDFLKTTVDNMETVQNAIKEAGIIIDTKLFPLIEEAENGDYTCMAELYEMFMYGENQTPKDYGMALRYAERLQSNNIDVGRPLAIAEGLKALAMTHYQFGELEKASKGFLEAFIYTVQNLQPKYWDKQVIQLVADNLEDYQEG